ncbi:MAG: hypothetical protein LBT99_00730 [Bifidobacteriaceae bacterium]|jgi:hypothetical protein|nr:hypothetical protein [Bifidobacteriaceae bacterium]
MVKNNSNYFRKFSLCKVISIFVLSVLFVGGLTACSGEINSQSEPPLDEIKTITDPSQITRPIDKYLYTAQEILSFYDAQDRKENQCFAKNGVSSNFTSFSNRDRVLQYINRTNNQEKTVIIFGDFLFPKQLVCGVIKVVLRAIL